MQRALRPESRALMRGSGHWCWPGSKANMSEQVVCMVGMRGWLGEQRAAGGCRDQSHLVSLSIGKKKKKVFFFLCFFNLIWFSGISGGKRGFYFWLGWIEEWGSDQEGEPMQNMQGREFLKEHTTYLSEWAQLVLVSTAFPSTYTNFSLCSFFLWWVQQNSHFQPLKSHHFISFGPSLTVLAIHELHLMPLQAPWLIPQ